MIRCTTADLGVSLGLTATYSSLTLSLYAKGSRTDPMPLVLELYTDLLLETLLTPRLLRLYYYVCGI